jgi:hypothetical protein
MSAYRIDDVIGANGLPQRKAATCANCQETRICTLSQVIGGGAPGLNAVIVKRHQPVYLCKWCRRRHLRDETHPDVVSVETSERAIDAYQRELEQKDSVEQLFDAVSKVNEEME